MENYHLELTHMLLAVEAACGNVPFGMVGFVMAVEARRRLGQAGQVPLRQVMAVKARRVEVSYGGDRCGKEGSFGWVRWRGVRSVMVWQLRRVLVGYSLAQFGQVLRGSYGSAR